MQFLGHPRAFDEAGFALAMARDPPEVRAIVDVERGLQTRCAGDLQRLDSRGFHLGVRQMGARGHDRARLADEVWVDVIHRQPHIRAILAIEDQWELFLIANPQQHERRQPLGVSLYATRIDTFAFKFLADVATHVLVADACDYR